MKQLLSALVYLHNKKRHRVQFIALFRKKAFRYNKIQNLNLIVKEGVYEMKKDCLLCC